MTTITVALALRLYDRSRDEQHGEALRQANEDLLYAFLKWLTPEEKEEYYQKLTEGRR